MASVAGSEYRSANPKHVMPGRISSRSIAYPRERVLQASDLFEGELADDVMLVVRAVVNFLATEDLRRAGQRV
jgi:hypothetical protein